MKRGRDSLGGGVKKAKTEGGSPVAKPQRKKNAREFYVQANRCVLCVSRCCGLLLCVSKPYG
jgi:hypothetical protein